MGNGFREMEIGDGHKIISFLFQVNLFIYFYVPISETSGEYESQGVILRRH